MPPVLVCVFSLQILCADSNNEIAFCNTIFTKMLTAESSVKSFWLSYYWIYRKNETHPSVRALHFQFRDVDIIVLCACRGNTVVTSVQRMKSGLHLRASRLAGLQHQDKSRPL